MQATRSDAIIGYKNVILFPDEKGEFHYLSKDAHSIIKHSRVANGYHEAQSLVIIAESDIGKNSYVDMVDELSIVCEHEFSMDESTWKYGCKSKDVDEDSAILVLLLFKMMTCIVTFFKMLMTCYTIKVVSQISTSYSPGVL